MKTILIVDDEPDVPVLFEQYYEDEIAAHKVKFEYAADAKSALEMLKQLDYVLILTDINMPIMSGIELLRVIKTTMPEKKVVMVTAYGDEKNRKKCQEYGADCLITKPINFDSLRQFILE